MIKEVGKGKPGLYFLIALKRGNWRNSLLVLQVWNDWVCSRHCERSLIRALHTELLLGGHHQESATCAFCIRFCRTPPVGARETAQHLRAAFAEDLDWVSSTHKVTHCHLLELQFQGL